MPDITLNGIKIHYERSGGDKPPVILLHGLSDSGCCWPRVSEALQVNYDVITPDARAHGLSEAPASGYSYDAMAADVAGLISTLELIKPAVIGHSMGGMMATVLGANYPDLPGCLVLEDPPFRDAAAEAVVESPAGSWSNLLKWFHVTPAEKMIAMNNSRLQGRTWDEVEYGPWVESKQQVDLNIIQLLDGDPLPWRELLAKITCPVLLVTADPAKGSIVTGAVAQEAMALNERIQVAGFPGAGHNIRRECFDDFMAAVSAFLLSART